MSFFDSFVDFGQGLVGKVVDTFLGDWSNKRSQRRSADYSYRNQWNLFKNSFDYELENIEDYRRDLGLTPQEFVGSVNPQGQTGAGVGTGTFGNMASVASNMRDVATAKRERDQLSTQKEIAEIQADAQRDVAEIQTGQQERSRVLEAAKFEFHKDLSNREFALLKREADNKAEKFNIEKETFTPAWLIAMKAASMGPENLRASAIYAYFKQKGFDLITDRGKVVSWKQLLEFLTVAGGEDSKLLKEVRGMTMILEGAAQGAKSVRGVFGNRQSGDGLSHWGDGLRGH